MSGVTQKEAGALFTGSPGKILAANGWDLRALRPVLRDNGPIRANDLLRKDEWKALDDAVVPTAKVRLGAIEDLRAAGLVRNLGSLGVLLDEYEKVSYIDAAEQSMSGVAPGQRDLAEFALESVPIPITFRDFQIHLRHLEASRRGGSNIDTTNAELCARRVAEKLDDMVFNGSTVAVGGNTVKGYTTATSRITGSLTAAWTNSGTRDIVGDVTAMIAAAEAQNFFGPFMLYVPVDYNAELRDDFKANSDKTFRQRLQEIDALSGIRATSSLSAEVVLVQMTRDVVDLSIASDIITVQWDEMGGMIQNFKVLAAMAPRVKIPHGTSAKTGVVHYSV